MIKVICYPNDTFNEQVNKLKPQQRFQEANLYKDGVENYLMFQKDVFMCREKDRDKIKNAEILNELS